MCRIKIRDYLTRLVMLGMVSVTTQVLASGFQLWEQSAATVGNYHAGYAADALDASTSFYNPAGITRFQNQQVVIGVVPILTSFRYRGDVGVSTINMGIPRGTTAQGGTFNLVPNLHYVAPITDKIGFGFSVTAPFGLKTDYGRSSLLRYAATLTSVAVVDISPALAYKATDQVSFGAGLDVQKMRGSFDMVAGSGGPENDTEATNRASGTGYGWHAGLLYEPQPGTRVGLSYHSKVEHRLKGSSRFVGPIATDFNEAYDLPPGPIVSENAKVNLTLPAYTALSAYHEVNPCLAVMASILYTQWSVFRRLTLQNIAGIDLIPTEFGLLPGPSTNITVTVPESWKNTWSFVIGANYNLTDKIMLRTGVGYDQSPVRNRYRNVQLPDGNRYAFAIGGHYQASNALGFDLGWTHLFMSQVDIHPPAQKLGIEEVTTNGKVSGGADVFGAQVTWNIV